jgi:acyl-ACP thioesterase
VQSKAFDNQDYSTYNTNRALDVSRWKIPVFPVEEGELRFTITIANSEYDHNFHVNNTRYADYCFNVFTIAELEEKPLKRFSFSYVKQCHEGDTLRFYRKYADGVWYVQGYKGENELVVQAEIALGDSSEIV